MGAREVIARACTPTPDECFHGSATLGLTTSEFHCLVKMWERELPRADAIIQSLQANGHVILSPDEVRGIRDEALEEAAVAAERTYAKDPFRFELNTAAAATIRSMKGGRDAQ